MSFAQTVILAAFAGGTIFLGLPVARVRGLSSAWQAALTTAAGGVILFLIYDVLAQALEPVDAGLDVARAGGSYADFATYATALGASIAAALLMLSYVSARATSRRRDLGLTLTPQQVAMGTAVGLGLHNFAEGLAIGASAASGATTFALLLVIGFALHNATEGFAIAAPLAPLSQSAESAPPTWRFLAGAGIVGGGPTFLGGVVGFSIVSPLISVAFLGLAAGALIFVFNEMMTVARRFSLPMVSALALTVGLLAAFGTDFLLEIAGG
jgi:zinc transporter, ZIP family